MSNRASSFALEQLAAVAARQTGATWIPITEADSFPAQWQFIQAESRAICLMCSRRAAKTYGVRLRTVKRSSEQPGWRTLIIHHTRILGKQQIYETGDPRNPGIREIMESHHIPEAHHDSTELNITFGNGSFVQVVGCDDKNEVGKKLGFLWNDIVLIECQEFDDEMLRRLVDKTILPTLIDRGGSLTLEGTPADVEAGLWYEAVMGDQWDRLGAAPGLPAWTLLDNPFIDRDEIVNTMKIRGYEIDFANPERNDYLIQREIFGRQVTDPSKLLYAYAKGRNDWPVTGVPFLTDARGLFPLTTWRFAMGIDIGGAREGNDKDACVVLGWRIDDGTHAIWERESWEDRQDSEAFCRRVLETFKRWQPMQSICADTGGAGAVKMLEWLKPRLMGLDFTPKPTSVDVSERMLNDEFRSGRLRVNPLGLIARDAKICTNPETYHSDVMPATRYAFHGAYSWLSKEKPKPKSIDAELERLRIARFLQQEKDARRPWQIELR